MKITIDTKEDSPEHIKKIIDFLTSMTDFESTEDNNKSVIIESSDNKEPEMINPDAMLSNLLEDDS